VSSVVPCFRRLPTRPAKLGGGHGDDEIPTLSTEKTMTVAIYICSAALLGGLAIGVYNLESWLERWDYKRHLED
jgi:hypothetical protein